jgi:hypothetical protein
MIPRRSVHRRKGLILRFESIPTPWAVWADAAERQQRHVDQSVASCGGALDPSVVVLDGLATAGPSHLPVIGRIEIPQRNSTEGMPFLSFRHGRY